MDFYFDGHWRMDWGLGNPNKTATLIAMLMVASWAPAFRWRHGFWVGVTLNFILGICLLQTYSRGGLIAAVLGLAVLVVRAPLPWPRIRTVAVLAGAMALLILSILGGTAKRYVQGIVGEDHSVRNRLLIWEQVPRMIFDAPGGWGVGQAGEAYMQWYQPTERLEGYRTLVNSHLTWLVEWGWMGRLSYLVMWIGIFILCWPRSAPSWMTLSFGVWLAFGIGAVFSSVAESPVLWIVPIGSLAAVVYGRFATRQWPSLRPSLLGASVSMTVALDSVVTRLTGMVKRKRCDNLKRKHPTGVMISAMKHGNFLKPISLDAKGCGEG